MTTVSMSLRSAAEAARPIVESIVWATATTVGQEVWARIASVPPPMGFDPVTIWPDGPDSDDFAVIELRPYRVQVVSAAEMAARLDKRQWSR